MDGKNQICLRSSLRSLMRSLICIWGVLLLVSIFTLQAQASFPEKAQTDLNSVIDSARQDLRETIQIYESDFQQRLAMEDAYLDQNVIPNWNLIAANRGK